MAAAPPLSMSNRHGFSTRGPSTAQLPLPTLATAAKRKGEKNGKEIDVREAIAKFRLRFPLSLSSGPKQWATPLEVLQEDSKSGIIDAAQPKRRRNPKESRSARQRLAVWFRENQEVTLCDPHRYTQIDQTGDSSEFDIGRENDAKHRATPRARCGTVPRGEHWRGPEAN
jgi:hypothetical protein